MKLLREYIRELLTESIDPKIMSMIDRAEEAGFNSMQAAWEAYMYGEVHQTLLEKQSRKNEV